MCGIAGLVAADRLDPLDRRGCRGCATCSPIAGPTRPGVRGRRSGRARPSPPEHRRSRRRAAAARRTRTAPCRSSSTARSTTTPTLRPELEARGHRYRTRSDTETIVHAYEQWGDACVHRFRGMFAFAIWDAGARRLLLVRDRLGIKPLYWARVGRPAPVRLGDQGDARERPRRAAAERGGAARAARHPRYVSGDETMFAGIHKLLPGHTGWCSSDGARHASASTGTSRTSEPAERGSAETRPPVDRAVPAAARGIGAAPADGRRAARHVPVGRHRQQRHRRAHGAHDRPAAQDVLGGVRGPRVQRARLRARRWPRAIGADAARGRDRRPRLLRRAAAARLARGRADRAPVERAAVLRLAARARARQGRADRRRQRRTARRLRQVSARRCSNWRAGDGLYDGCCPRRSRPGSPRASCRAFRAALGALRAAIVPRRCDAHAGGDVLRQLRRRSGSPRQRALLRRTARAPGDARARLCAPRSPGSTRPPRQQPCSTACSTRT